MHKDARRYRYESQNHLDSPRDARKIIAFEIENLGNTDILKYVCEHYVQNYQNEILQNIQKKEETLFRNTMRIMEQAWQGRDIFQKHAFNPERLADTILRIVNMRTNKNIKYALWLAEKNAVEQLYANDNAVLCEFEPSEIILSDLGFDGTLFGYENIPKQINKTTEYNLLGYDKDTDVYISYGTSSDLSNLIEIGEMLKEKLNKGTLHHTLSNGKSEPIDWLEIYRIGDKTNKKYWTSY